MHTTLFKHTFFFSFQHFPHMLSIDILMLSVLHKIDKVKMWMLDSRIWLLILFDTGNEQRNICTVSRIANNIVHCAITRAAKARALLVIAFCPQVIWVLGLQCFRIKIFGRRTNFPYHLELLSSEAGTWSSSFASKIRPLFNRNLRKIQSE